MKPKKIYYYERKPNYSEKQEQEIRKKAPHNYASAKLLAKKFGKTIPSVISKIKELDIKYFTREDTTPKKIRYTREDIVTQIQQATGLEFSKHFEKRINIADLTLLRDYIDKQQQLL